LLALQGIDRAMALAAQAFTALNPLLLVVSAVAPSDRRDLVSDAVIRKFQLAGGAAQAVKQLFARPGDSAIGILSVVLLVFSGVSLTRRMRRMYLQAWRLEPFPGVRGSLSAAVGLTALLLRPSCCPSGAHSSVACRSTGYWARRSSSWRASCSGPRFRGFFSTGGSRGGGCSPPGC
jgi:hypothetical protein